MLVETIILNSLPALEAVSFAIAFTAIAYSNLRIRNVSLFRIHTFAPRTGLVIILFGHLYQWGLRTSEFSGTPTPFSNSAISSVRIVILVVSKMVGFDFLFST